MRRESTSEPAVIPDGWSALQIRDFAEVRPGGRLGLTKADYRESGIPAFSAAGQDGLVSVAEYDRRGVILSSIGARCGKCFFGESEWTTLANTQVILPDETKVDAQFLWQYINDERYWHRSGSAQPFIAPSTVKSAWVAAPPLSEQRKIAAILSSIDETIEKSEMSIEQLSKLRTALGQDLLRRGLPGRHRKYHQTRYGEFPECWSVCQIRDIARVRGGKRMPKGRPFATGKTMYPYIRVSDFQRGSVRIAGLKYVLPEDQVQIRQYTISSSDLYISIAGTLGLVGQVPDDLDGAQLTENAAKICEIDSALVNRAFLMYVLQSQIGQAQFEIQKGVGAGVPKLALFRIEEVGIPLPGVEEQVRISQVLRCLDERIEAEEQWVIHLRGIKAALMADLLSGTLRVTPDEAFA